MCKICNDLEANIVYENANSGNCIWYKIKKDIVIKYIGLEKNKNVFTTVLHPLPDKNDRQQLNIYKQQIYDIEYEHMINESNGYDLIEGIEYVELFK